MNVAQIIQKKNKKFDEWIKTMISEESEDHYLIAGTAIETGYTADLQVAFEAGQPRCQKVKTEYCKCDCGKHKENGDY